MRHQAAPCAAGVRADGVVGVQVRVARGDREAQTVPSEVHLGHLSGGHDARPLLLHGGVQRSRIAGTLRGPGGDAVVLEHLRDSLRAYRGGPCVVDQRCDALRLLAAQLARPVLDGRPLAVQLLPVIHRRLGGVGPGLLLGPLLGPLLDLLIGLLRGVRHRLQV